MAKELTFEGALIDRLDKVVDALERIADVLELGYDEKEDDDD